MNLDDLVAATERANLRRQGCKHPQFTGMVREYLDRVDAEVEDPMPTVVTRTIRMLGGTWRDEGAALHYRGDCDCGPR